MARSQKDTIKLPAGRLYFPKLGTPDTAFHDDGTYVADLRYTPEEFEPVRAEIKRRYKEAHGKAAPSDGRGLWRKAREKTGEEDDGTPIYEDGEDFVVKVQAKNRMTKKGKLWDRKPNIWDGAGNLVENADDIGGGTVAMVNAEINHGTIKGGKPYFQMIPTDVLIIEMVEKAAGSNGQENPFGDEDMAQSQYTAPTRPGFAGEDGDDAEGDDGDY